MVVDIRCGGEPATRRCRMKIESRIGPQRRNNRVTRINEEVRRIIADPAFRTKFLEPQLFESMVATPAEFAAEIKAETETWRKVIADAKIRIE